MCVNGIGHFYKYIYNIKYDKHVFVEVSRTNGLLKIVLAIFFCQNCLMFIKMFASITNRLFQWFNVSGIPGKIFFNRNLFCDRFGYKP